MEIREYKIFNEAEILRLYRSVGWTAYTDHLEVLQKGFEKSMLTLAAYEGDQLLGIIRAVGDGHTIVFVQDILVFPEYQRKGILFIAAAIGDDKQNIERIYGNSFLDITDLSQLPIKLTSIIKKHLQF